jgi:hypothetical protein
LTTLTFILNVHCTISNLSLSCPCIQRKEFSFTITNANVYVNLFLFHLRSEILIIEGYYTKYPNPTISFFHFHFKESYETFSFSCSNLSLSSPYIYIQRIFLHHHHYTKYPNPTISFFILRKVMKHFHFSC